MQLSLLQIFAAITAIAVLLAVPQIELELPEGVVLTMIILHQIACASLFGFMVWTLLGRRKLIGLLFLLVICGVWLPYSLDLIQRLAFGDPTFIHSATETLGITEEYAKLWYIICNKINYQMTISID